MLDAHQQVHGHPGLHVVDGSAVSANLGVNPSLTITAQAERVFARWPRRDAVPTARGSSRSATARRSAVTEHPQRGTSPHDTPHRRPGRRDSRAPHAL